MRAVGSRFGSRRRPAYCDGATMPDQSTRFRCLRTPVRVGAAVVVLLAAVQACSSIPDAANPVEWYKGTRDWVTGDDASAIRGSTSRAESRAHGEHTFGPGDCCMQPAGIVHNELDCSDDLELLEITSPARYETVVIDGKVGATA